MVFIQNLLLSIGFEIGQVPLFGDNKGSICLAKDPQDHQKSKHISVRYFYIRQRYEEGRIDIKYVKTAEQLADAMTKALLKEQHERLVLTIMGYNPPVED